MRVTHYGRFYGPEKLFVYAEVYKSADDDGLIMDEFVTSRKFFTRWGAKRWIEKTILNLSCSLSEWYYITEDTVVKKRT